MTNLDEVAKTLASMPGYSKFRCRTCEDWGTVVVREENGNGAGRETACPEPIHAESGARP